MANNAINSLIKDAELIIAQTTNDSTGGRVGFLKSRGAIVQNGDTIGIFTFYGNDGNSTEIAGTIAGIVNGPPADDRMPLDLRFSTRPDVAASGNTERLRISASGTVTIFTPTSGNALTINGTTQHTSLGVGVMQTNVSGVVSSTSGSDGQIIIGALGSAPAWANIVSSDGTVVVTNTPHGIDLGASGGSLVNSITGTANQITASAATGDVTLSVHTTFTGPGYVEATTNFRLPTTTSTAGQILINGTRFFHAYGTDNLFIGSEAGNFTLTQSAKVMIGLESGKTLTTGNSNVSLGYQAAKTVTSASNNVILGTQAAIFLVSGAQNVAIGSGALGAATTNESGNTCIGWGTLGGLNGGDYNLALGYRAGINYTSAESSN